MNPKDEPLGPGDEHGICAYSDAVLSLLLDGESGNQLVQEPGWDHAISATELTRHLQECVVCAGTIARARRLDALLAGATNLAFDGKEADELLARVTAAAEPVGSKPIESGPEAVAHHGNKLRATLIAAGLLLLGFIAGSQLWNEESVSSKTVLPKTVSPLLAPTVATDSSAAELDPGMTRLPDRSRRPVTRLRLSALAPRQLLAFAEGSQPFRTGATLLNQFASASALPGLWRSSRALSVISDSIRDRALSELVSSNHPQASSTVTAALATWRDGPALQSLLALARGQARVQARLARRMGDPMVLRAAARLGGRDLDRRLRSLGASRSESIAALVEALASLAERPGRVALLLDLWEDLERKGGDRDDLNLAREWFVPLPFTSGSELREEFARSRHANRRRHCLLAMAAQASPMQSEFLLRTVVGPRLPESELAAFALGQLAVDGDDLHAQLDASRRSYLLLTALACREDPRLSRIIERMELTQEEARFLDAGAFTPEQFMIAASLFRNRRGLVGL